MILFFEEGFGKMIQQSPSTIMPRMQNWENHRETFLNSFPMDPVSEGWTAAKSSRRVNLIEKKIHKTITLDERMELEDLNEQMWGIETEISCFSANEMLCS
jgi:hypothetical protein